MTLTAWYLNVFCNVSFSLIFLTVAYILGGMQIIKCKLKGQTFREEKRKKEKEEDILNEESLQKIIIAFYIILNWLVEVFRDIIQWNKPLQCGALTFAFLSAAAVTTFTGDNGLFWACVFLSFCLPSLVMRKSRRQ